MCLQPNPKLRNALCAQHLKQISPGYSANRRDCPGALRCVLSSHMVLMGAKVRLYPPSDPFFIINVGRSKGLCHEGLFRGNAQTIYGKKKNQGGGQARQVS